MFIAPDIKIFFKPRRGDIFFCINLQHISFNIGHSATRAAGLEFCARILLGRFDIHLESRRDEMFIAPDIKIFF